MEISQAGIDLIKDFEGFRSHAYLDSVGVPTIGYGHTKGVKLGDVIDDAKGDQYLREDTQDAQDAVNRLVTVPLTQSQFDALTSWTFNLGQGNLASSTLLRKLNAGDYSGAGAEFEKWAMAGGQKLPGLVRRRAAERKMFESA